MAQEYFTYTRTVAFGECDAARVLYTPRAIDYGVEAVESWFEDTVGLSWPELVRRHGLELRFRTMECDFLRPMVAGQAIHLQVRVVELVADTVTLQVVAERDRGGQVLKFSFGISFGDLAGGAAVPIPAAFAESIRQYRSRYPEPGPLGGNRQESGADRPGKPSPVVLKDAMPLTRQWRIRYGECGVSGTVYLPKLIECIVERVGEWYQSCLGIAWLDQCASGKGVPFVNIQCDCLRPLAAGDTVTIAVRVPRLGTASIGYEVTGYDPAGNSCFVAQLSACYIIEQNGSYRVLPFPEEMRGRILAYQQRCEDAA